MHVPLWEDTLIFDLWNISHAFLVLPEFSRLLKPLPYKQGMHARGRGKKKPAALNTSIWFWIFNKSPLTYWRGTVYKEKILTYKEVKKKKKKILDSQKLIFPTCDKGLVNTYRHCFHDESSFPKIFTCAFKPNFRSDLPLWSLSPGATFVHTCKEFKTELRYSSLWCRGPKALQSLHPKTTAVIFSMLKPAPQNNK